MAPPKATQPKKKPLPERETLGWLAQSAVPPKKQRLIEGVGASSLVDLKAQYYKTQEEARQAREAGINPAQRRRKPSDALGDGNTGVGERDRKDRLHVKSPGQRAAECYAALERKAALYDRLAAGDYNSDDEGRYNVDFLYKEAQGQGRPAPEAVDDQGSWVPQRFGRGGGAAPDTMGQASHAATGGMDTESMATERARRAWEEEQAVAHAAELQAADERAARTEAVLQAAAALQAERARAEAAKADRHAATERKRERLKAEFLKRQLQQKKNKQGS